MGNGVTTSTSRHHQHLLTSYELYHIETAISTRPRTLLKSLKTHPGSYSICHRDDKDPKLGLTNCTKVPTPVQFWVLWCRVCSREKFYPSSMLHSYNTSVDEKYHSLILQQVTRAADLRHTAELEACNPDIAVPSTALSGGSYDALSPTFDDDKGNVSSLFSLLSSPLPFRLFALTLSSIFSLIFSSIFSYLLVSSSTLPSYSRCIGFGCIQHRICV